mmetsp:Transcript_25451/g.29129  ORF Transcript_25451/g.29129 Transcript_25451/m.29129 type:complete len:231 (+) Transcript_25451:66-758(+)
MAKIYHLSYYYFGLAFITLVLGIYCLTFSGDYGDDFCLKARYEYTYGTVDVNTCQKLDPDQKTGAGGTEPAKASTHLTILVKWMGIFYMTVGGTALLSAIMIFYFSSLSSDQFFKLSFGQYVMGMFTKLFPFLLRFFHFLVVPLILIQWIFILVGDCEDSIHVEDDLSITCGRMHEIAVILNIIMSIVWGLLHVVGGTLRNNLHRGAYLYEPIDPKTPAGKLFIFKKYGP